MTAPALSEYLHGEQETHVLMEVYQDLNYRRLSMVLPHRVDQLSNTAPLRCTLEAQPVWLSIVLVQVDPSVPFYSNALS